MPCWVNISVVRFQFQELKAVVSAGVKMKAINDYKKLLTRNRDEMDDNPGSKYLNIWPLEQTRMYA